MMSFMSVIFCSKDLIPPGYSYPGLVSLHVASYPPIGIDYTSYTIGSFKRNDVPWMSVSFDLLILASGMTPVLEVWIVSNAFWLSGGAKVSVPLVRRHAGMPCADRSGAASLTLHKEIYYV